MRHGFMGTTWKPRRSRHSENIQNPRGQKRPGKCGAKSKWCWPFSLTSVGWCITSMQHKAITLTKNTTWKSFITFVMLCGARDQTCEQQERGSCIMTTHQLIPRNWFRLSWPNTTFLWFDRLPTLLTWLPVTFGCSPTWKRSWKAPDLSHEMTLYVTRRPSCTPFAKRHSRNALNNGGTAVGDACSVTRRLLWRGLGLQTSKRVNVFFPAKGQILFEQARYTHNL